RVAGGGPSDSTEWFTGGDVTTQAAFPRRARAFANPRGRADGQCIVPVKTAPGLPRESVVDVRAVRGERERPARIEGLPGPGHIEARHRARRKIARVNQD